MFDTRAAILEKMGMLEEALMDCKRVIDAILSCRQVSSSLIDDFSSVTYSKPHERGTRVRRGYS